MQQCPFYMLECSCYGKLTAASPQCQVACFS
jgi:hypothetical protein